MEIKIIEEKKNKIVFEIEGATHTLCNALRDELNKDNAVKAAGYHISHPQMGVPEFTVETTQGNEARKAVTEAIKRIKKTNAALLKQADKLK